MQRNKFVLLFAVMIIVLSSCHREGTRYHDTQAQFANDPNFRLGKWYSVADVGMTLPSYDARLDTIWFINDTTAGWTGFGGHPYSFFKTYVDPENLYNLIYVAPNVDDPNKLDTVGHQFGFTRTGDTLTIFWNFNTIPPQTESYVKKQN